jgi:hypothetical protein
MYILVKPDQSTVYPYSIKQLMKDNPNTSFRQDMTDGELSLWGVYPVEEASYQYHIDNLEEDTPIDANLIEFTKCPRYDRNSQRLVEDTPTNVEGVWTRSWRVVSLTEAEIATLQRDEQLRKNHLNREYLKSTDWYLLRKFETGVEIPAEILTARQAARDSIVVAG